MKIIESARDMRGESELLRRAGLSLGFVPTLGGLHAGHRALLDRARSECERVSASIYLNPTQFDSPADLATYPASMDADLSLCESAGVDIVWLGRRADLFPDGFQTWVEVERLTRPLCGAFRPGHFRGVTTIVAELLAIAKPHRAYFGLKDFQQALAIERMVRDLWLDTEVVKVPTVREPDGLALSSRNARLAPEERAVAPALYRSLVRTRELLLGGEHRVDALEAFLRRAIEEEPRFRVEYAEVVRAADLEPFSTGTVDIDAGVLIAVAAHLGSARLIDNVWLPPARGGDF